MNPVRCERAGWVFGQSGAPVEEGAHGDLISKHSNLSSNVLWVSQPCLKRQAHSSQTNLSEHGRARVLSCLILWGLFWGWVWVAEMVLEGSNGKGRRLAEHYLALSLCGENRVSFTTRFQSLMAATVYMQRALVYPAIPFPIAGGTGCLIHLLLV